METKLFLIDEHKETIFEGAEIEKWKALVDELGLVEQAKLIEGNKSPLPFPVMTEAQQVVYSAILDNHVDYKQFTGEAIPLSVLSLIAFAEKEKHFVKIEIWHSRQNPDPLVVGLNWGSEDDKKNDYYWRMIPSLIAQWGPKIKPLSELLPLYDTYKRSELDQSYKNQIQQHERNMEKYRFQGNAFYPEKPELSF